LEVFSVGDSPGGTVLLERSSLPPHPRQARAAATVATRNLGRMLGMMDVPSNGLVRKISYPTRMLRSFLYQT